MKCQKIGCQKEASHGQKYCSADHAPYGNWGKRAVKSQQKDNAGASTRNDITKSTRQNVPRTGLKNDPQVVSTTEIAIKEPGKEIVSGSGINGENRTPGQSSVTLMPIDQGRSTDMNLIDGCAKRLDSLSRLLLMDIKGGKRKNGGCIDEPIQIDPIKANAACNCVKNLTNLLRLKNDIRKGMSQ